MKRTLIVALALLGTASIAEAQMQTQHRPGHGPGPGHNNPGPLPGPGHNNPGQGWRLLAFKTVGAGTDRDTINVRTDRFWRSLQLCSINAPIQMQDFKVIYGNGRAEDIRVRSRIGAGTCTRAIQLRGGNRRITQIRLVYGKLDRSMRVPLIRVMAR